VILRWGLGEGGNCPTFTCCPLDSKSEEKNRIVLKRFTLPAHTPYLRHLLLSLSLSLSDSLQSQYLVSEVTTLVTCAVAATVVVDGVMLPAEDKIMTSSTDEYVADDDDDDDDDERIPVWIGKSSSQTCQW